mmetsp:Transcript_11299/g.35114  ORF Transcript_11299/g.35114 Transcript_11299/m.35114 type:complete len:285 (-) Transcript_11299:1333-2187(-)
MIAQAEHRHNRGVMRLSGEEREQKGVSGGDPVPHGKCMLWTRRGCTAVLSGRAPATWKPVGSNITWHRQGTTRRALRECVKFVTSRSALRQALQSVVDGVEVRNKSRRCAHTCLKLPQLPGGFDALGQRKLRTTCRQHLRDGANAVAAARGLRKRQQHTVRISRHGREQVGGCRDALIIEVPDRVLEDVARLAVRPGAHDVSAQHLHEALNERRPYGRGRGGDAARGAGVGLLRGLGVNRGQREDHRRAREHLITGDGLKDAGPRVGCAEFARAEHMRNQVVGV